MRGQIVKAMRREAVNARNQAIGIAGQMTQALNVNEETTRGRVEALERRMSSVESHATDLLCRGFWSRLSWLFFGK